MYRRQKGAGFVLLVAALSAFGQGTASAPTHITLADRPWTSSEQYPEALRRVYRYKAMIGGTRAGVIPQPDVLFGMLELAPRAIYPAHKHPAPEIYPLRKARGLAILNAIAPGLCDRIVRRWGRTPIET